MCTAVRLRLQQTRIPPDLPRVGKRLDILSCIGQGQHVEILGLFLGVDPRYRPMAASPLGFLNRPRHDRGVSADELSGEGKEGSYLAWGTCRMCQPCVAPCRGLSKSQRLTSSNRNVVPDF